MFKKSFKLLTIASVLSMSLMACGSKETSKTNKKPAEVVLVTGMNSIDDKSFNQGAWEGLTQYAKEHNMETKYYDSPDSSETSITSTLELAISGGAKVVVCPGYLFEVPLNKVQEKHPDVNFILLDGAPHNGDYVPNINNNVAAFTYSEEQSGFLAGYATVMDGNKKLGFMGGSAAPAVARFGYGFVQGAEYAAKQLGLNKGDVTVDYTYVGSYEATPENQSKAAAWYNNGTEVIFGCGGGLGNSVMSAAEAANKKVIGVDVDQSTESPTVITSAMKNLSKSVYDALTAYYNGTLTTGVATNLDITTGGVLLPMDTSVFTSFNKENYDSICSDLVDGKISILKNTDVDSVTKLPLELVKVTELN